MSMAIADAVLSAIKEEKLQEKAQQLGEQLIAGLKALMDKHPCIGDVRGWGLMIGVEIVKERETRQPDKDLAFTLSQRWVCVSVLIDTLDIVNGLVYYVF